MECFGLETQELEGFTQISSHISSSRFPEASKVQCVSHALSSCYRGVLSRVATDSATDAPLKFMDGTMLPVCKHKRADDHKVAKGVANFGKNWQGWHFGFKLHASVTRDGELCALAFTQASVHEKNLVPKLLGTFTKIAVGDSSYGGKNLRETLWKTRGTYILAPAFHGQKKLMAKWQEDLLEQRSCIESVFDYLKEHLHLVTSFPRSVYGYLAHYAMVLLGYQVMKIWGI